VKIDDREVPAAIVAHWKQALAGLPDAALSGVARVHTSIQAGFRPGKVPPAQVKQRAGVILVGTGSSPLVPTLTGLDTIIA
jgi:hypothetical protein